MSMNEFQTEWWHWLIVAAALLTAEAITPTGTFLLLTGAAALPMALLKLSGMHTPLWGDLLIYAALATAAVYFLRKPIQNAMRGGGPNPAENQWTGEIGQAEQDIPPGERGRGRMQGTTWTVLNQSSGKIAAGQNFTVLGHEGLVLHVQTRREDSGAA